MANGDSEGTGLLTAKDAVLAGLARYLTCIGLVAHKIKPRETEPQPDCSRF